MLQSLVIFVALMLEQVKAITLEKWHFKTQLNLPLQLLLATIYTPLLATI
jgi:hypothetical protein